MIEASLMVNKCHLSFGWDGSDYQALAGSRDFQSAKIPGFFGIFCCYVLDPLERSLALRQFVFLHIFSPTITLFIDGKGTTHKDKYKYTILTGKQFEKTFENAQSREPVF